MSPKVTELLGYEITEVIGKPAELFIHPQDYPHSREFYLQAFMTGKTMTGNEYRIRHKDGTWQWHSQSISPIHDTKGTVVRVQGISRDISEGKRAEEAIRKANRQLNLLTGITRHDILNQVTGLLGYLDFALDNNTDEKIQEFLSRCVIITETIQNQIEFTKVFEDIGSYSPIWQNIEEIIRRVERDLKTAGLTYHHDLDGVLIYADPLFEKVIFTLVENTIRHGERATDVWFSYKKDLSGLTLFYEDNGVGVVRENKLKIFRRGFGKHTGFGLSISEEIMSITDITITENGEPGVGVRFEIFVPSGKFKFGTG